MGIAVSGPIAEQSHRLFAPLRDLFAATFFFFFGLEIDSAQLPQVIPFAVALGLTPLSPNSSRATGPRTRRAWKSQDAIARGAALVARGEFSIVIAGLGGGIRATTRSNVSRLRTFLAILGPFLARATK